MKDYITKAKSAGIHILPCWETDWVRNYKLDRKSRELTISYWKDGAYLFYIKKDKIKICPPEKEKEMIEELDDMQREQFAKMYEEVTKELKRSLKWNIPIATVYLTNGVLQTCIGNFLGASVWTAGSLIYTVPLTLTPKSFKLVREMKLVKWIIENRDAVDALIRREVDEVRDVDLSHTDPIVQYDVYPTNRTPYPEEIYNEGINLNNIESLDNKTLQGIKKKVLKMQKEFSSNKGNTSSKENFSSYFD